MLTTGRETESVKISLQCLFVLLVISSVKIDMTNNFSPRKMEKIINRKGCRNGSVWGLPICHHAHPQGDPTEEIRSIFSWIQKYFHMPTKSLVLLLPSLPSRGQSKGVLFCFVLLFFLLLVAAMKRKYESNLKIILMFFSGSNTRSKILSQRYFYATCIKITWDTC